jgi:NADPH:quinone reductase
MRAVTFTGVGGDEVVAVADRPDPLPGDGQVLIAPRFAGLNPADLLQRAGRYPAPPGWPADIPGLEVAGRVVAVGPGMATWRVGDRVLGLVGGGGLADRVVADGSALVRVPDELDDLAAAAVPEAFVTAHDALVTCGGLAAGQLVVVQGANGGVGTAAVQLAAAAGARVLAVHRDPEAHDLLASLGAVPVPAGTLAAAVERVGEGRGVDLVLELVGAPNLADDLSVLATAGRIVVVGVSAGARVELSLLDLMGRRASLVGTVMRSRSRQERADAVAAFARDVVPLLADGRVAPVIEHVAPLAGALEAFARLARPGRRGKVLLDLG